MSDWIAIAGPPLGFALQIAAGWMLADFLSGVLHWAEDRYGSPRWPIVGGAVRDTIRHHRKPRGFLKKPVVARSWRVFFLAGVGFTAFALAGFLNAFSLTFVLAVALANEIHAAAHVGPGENWPVVRWLQKLGVIQSPEHHAAHHRGLKNVNYCTLTDWLNPMLERVRFWRRLEALIRIATRERPRRDPVVRRRQRRRWHRA